MVAFTKYKGNYIEVTDALGLSEDFYQEQSKTLYDSDIAKDLPRICYASAEYTATQIQQRLQDTSRQLNHSDNSLAYTQGNFPGNFFTQAYLSTLPRAHQGREEADNKGILENYHGTLAMSYVDDSEKLCGVGIAYFRDDSDESMPLNQRQLLFNVSIIRNTTFAPLDREVTYYSHPDLLTEQNAMNGEPLDNTLLADITHTLHSKAISQLLSMLLTNDQLSLTEFLALKARLKGNQNIDDRDAKRAKLQGIILTDSTHPQAKVLTFVASIMLRDSAADINYFKTISHEELDLLIQNPVQSPIFNAHASLLKRNAGNFILTGLGWLTVFSVVLLLSGVLSPFGLTLAAGLSNTLAVAVGTIASLFVMERTLRIQDYEQDLKSLQQQLVQQAQVDRSLPAEEPISTLPHIEERPQQSSQTTVVEPQQRVVDSKAAVKPNPGASPFSVFHHNHEQPEADEPQSDNTLANK